MKLCELCKLNEANKPNTHYLTDSIIRTCLNIDGSNSREKGLYFDVSNYKSPVEFNIQRNTPIHLVENELKRNLYESEINKAFNTSEFSVDYIFCSKCEDIFTSIETSFNDNLLKKFRNSNLTNSNNLICSEIKTIRLFFYIQLWRSSICDDNFEIDAYTMEILRKFILNHNECEAYSLNQFPLSISYLETLYDKTSNLVGIISGKNPNVIFMNDFIIQFYNNKESINFWDFHGLNNKDNYSNFINIDEKAFVFKIINNNERTELINSYLESKAKDLKIDIINFFDNCFMKLTGLNPSIQQVDEFYKEFINSVEPFLTKYSEVSIRRFIANYLQNILY